MDCLKCSVTEVPGCLLDDWIKSGGVWHVSDYNTISTGEKQEINGLLLIFISCVKSTNRM